MINVASELWGAIIFTAISAVILWLASKNGFFKPLDDGEWRPDLSFWHVIGAYGIYFGLAIYFPRILAPLLYRASESWTQLALLSWISFLSSVSIFIGLAILWRSLSYPTRMAIWRSNRATQPYFDDLKFAALTWCIAFPVVLAMSQFLDLLVYYVFNVTSLPDQVAVYFVKMTFAQPFYFFMAILTIVILAPLVEELLFRGFLQSFIRKHLGPHQAILITSLCFSFFHFSPEQGLSNIPIVGSLFSLALFLGYLYERQQSLFASIALHALFNGISVLNLYFLGGVPRGAL